MKPRFVKRIAVVSATALISLSGAAALAQPGPHGAHGAPGGDFSFGIAALKDQLNLNTSQQAMWDNAVAQTKTARDTGRANMQRIKDTMSTELAKAEPDLAAVGAVSDDVQATNTALRKQVRGTWLTLYATFSPEQKAIVKNAIQQRMTRMESFRQKWLQRHGG